EEFLEKEVRSKLEPAMRLELLRKLGQNIGGRRPASARSYGAAGREVGEGRRGKGEGRQEEGVRLVGTGGTASILARMEEKLEVYDRARIEAARLGLDRVRWHAERLWSLP